MLNKTLFEMSFSKKNFMACFSKKKTRKTFIKKMYLYFKENNIFYHLLTSDMRVMRLAPSLVVH